MKKASYNLIAEKLEGEKLIAFDIGSKGGVYSFSKLQKFIDYYGFEPNHAEFEKLKPTDEIKYFPIAIGAKPGHKDFNITHHSSYSSFLKLDELNFEKHFGLMKDYKMWKKGMQIEKTISVEVQTLNNVLRENTIDSIDFLKLDTQGTELEILKGANNLLNVSRLGVLFCEFNFMKIYKKQNSFSELDLYLRQFDYECIDCRFYPNAIRRLHKGSIMKKIYDQPRYSVGGDAVIVPQIESSKLDQKSMFKIGLLLAELGYISVSHRFFRECNLTEIEIQTILKYMRTFSIKKLGIELIPPFIYEILKSVVKK